MDSSTSMSNKRNSFLPRPGMTKLPLPGSATSQGPAVTPSTTSSNGIKSPTSASNLATFGTQRTELSRPQKQNYTNRSLASAPPPRSKPNSQSAIAPRQPASNASGSTVASRQPLTSPSFAKPTPQHERQTSVTSNSSDASRFRQNSLQSDFATDGHSSEDSELFPSAPTSPDTNGSSIKLPKKPRPSLSDRTIETLSAVPPSPDTSNRRRSGYFNGQTPQRPSSMIGAPSTASKLNYSSGTIAGKGPAGGFIRPPSPSKNKTPSTYRPGHVPKRSLSTNTGIAKPPGSTYSASPYSARAPSPTAARPLSTATSIRSSTSRPSSRIGSFTSKSPLRRPGQSARSPTDSKDVGDRPVSVASLRRPSSQIRSPDEASTRSPIDPLSAWEPPDRPEKRAEALPTSESPPDEKKPSSSSTLRQQIAEAKAVARNSQRNKNSEEENQISSACDFENVEDPFNTKPKDGKDLLRKRVDDARRDGRLNIAAMGLLDLPDEVISMYDSQQMESSSVPWNEAVDLVRFNAADNDISELPEKAFPDVSLADLVEDEESKGNQFGGLEHLDLHGNKLTNLTMGIRQLTRLTTLNLSRNNLETSVFDIVTKIPTLCDLKLANNQFTHELPESIGRLSLLETLDLSHNKLNSLPASMRELSRLRTLSLSHNRLQSLPFGVFNQLKTLRELSASHNAFSGALFPSSVAEMKNLKILDVSDNAVASLNFSKVLKLPSLIRLDISRNRLGMFPDISEWINLTVLVADENALSDLPRGMVNLKEKLKTVSLERNSIRDVDEAVADMEALETLGVAGNPLRERKLLNMDTYAIKQEMSRRRDLAREFTGS